MENRKVHLRAITDIPRWSCVTASGELANSGVPAHQDHIMGVTEGDVALGDWGDVTTNGRVFNKDWTWTPGARLYLNGIVLSQTPPGVGFVQQIGWAISPQSMVMGVMVVGGAPGPPGPPGPSIPSVIIRDSWSAAPPANPAVDTICVYRDGTPWQVWDAVFATWMT